MANDDACKIANNLVNKEGHASARDLGFKWVNFTCFTKKGNPLLYQQFAYCVVQSVPRSQSRAFFPPQFRLKLPLANLLQVGQVRAQHLKRPFWACKQSWILAPRHFLANFLRQACQEPQKFWLIDFAHIFRQIEVFVCIVLLICIRMPIHRRELHNCIQQRKNNEKWCCLFSSKKKITLDPSKLQDFCTIE